MSYRDFKFSEGKNRVVLIGIALALSYWLLEAFMDTLFGEGQFIERLLAPDDNELWMRAIIMTLIVAFSIYIQADRNRRQQTEMVLRESEERFRTLFERSPDALLLFDPHDQEVLWRIVDCNPACSRINGYGREELIGQGIALLTTNHLDPANRAAYVDRLRREGSIHGETVHRRKDGSLFHIEFSTSLIALGGRELVLGIDRDITERKRAEEALRASEERFRLLVDGARDYAMLMLDTDGKVVSWSEGAERILGYQETEIIGQSGSLLFTPDDRQQGAPEQELKMAAAEGRAEDERWHVRKDGSRFWASGVITALCDEKGKLRGFAKVMRDATERKLVEEAVRNSEARLAGIIDSAMDAIISVDANQCVVVFNSAAEKMFRCRAAEVVGQPIDRFIPPRFRDRHRMHIPSFGQTGVTARSMHSLQPLMALRADGEEFPIEASISQIETAGQKVYTVIIRDITERKRAEEERERLLAQVESERARLNAVLQQMPAGVIIAEAPSGKLIMGNEQVQRIWHQPFLAASDVDQYHEYQGFHADGSPYQPQEWPLSRAIRTGEVITDEEIEILRGDGTPGTISNSAAPIRDSEGRIVAGVVTFHDITERKQAKQRLSVQYAVSRILADGGDVNTAAPELLGAIGEALGWEYGGFWIVDQPANVLHCSATWHAPSVRIEAFEVLSRQLTLAPGIGLPGHVWAQGTPIWLSDMPQDDTFPRSETALREGLHGAFAFPIQGHNGILGVIEFFSGTFQEPDGALLRTVTTLGNQIGQFLERQSAEQEVRASEARKAAMLETALDGIISIDAQGRIQEWNPAAEQIFGYRSEEAVGREMAELIIPPSLRERHRRGLAQYLATGQGRIMGQRREMIALRADGSEFPVELAINPIPQVGAPMFTGFIRDITERKRAEQEREDLLHQLETERKQLEVMLQQMPAGVVIANKANGSKLTVNQHAVDLFGLPLSMSGERLVQIEPTQFNHNDHQFWHTAGTLLTTALSGQSSTGVEVCSRAENDEIPLIASAAPIFAGDNHVVGAVGVFQDARPFREAEMLREVDRLKTELIANISHDLRTPLHLIRGCATTLRDGNAPPDLASTRVYLDMIVEESDKLGAMVQDLLDASQIEHGMLQLKIESVELDQLLKRTVQHWQATAAHQFELQMPDEVPPIPGDVRRLTQVIDNLLGNAVRYTADHTRIEVELHVEPDKVTVSVRDHGPGVAPEHLPHLFDRFYRAGSKTQRRDTGSGLGLFICKGIVEQHGGRLWAEPTPGTGLTFYICLPRRYKPKQTLDIELP